MDNPINRVRGPLL